MDDIGAAPNGSEPVIRIVCQNAQEKRSHSFIDFPSTISSAL